MTNLLHDYPELAELKPAPVVQVQCPVCGGTGWRETRVDDLGHGHGDRCVYCAGLGYVWIEADHAQ